MFFKTISDVDSGRSVIRNRAYGVIEVCDQQLKAIHMRPYPKLISIPEIYWSSFWKKHIVKPTNRDRVLLYYNQPVMHRNFISLNYFVSDDGATLASIAVCLSVLDYVAKVKRTDAMVTEISNKRIKDRHLAHFGWEEHRKEDRGRHWVKRFYGQYPESFLFQAIGDQPGSESIPNSHDSGKSVAPPAIFTPHYQTHSTRTPVK